MILTVLLALFGLACLLLIADGLRRRAGIFEFSFLAGCGMLGFLFMQAVGVVSNPGIAPEAGVAKALVMCTLCTFATYLGWKAPLGAKRASGSGNQLPQKWVYWFGVACVVAGTLGSLGIVRLNGGLLGVNAVQGRHVLVYRGMPVVYYFFGLYGYLGLVLVLLFALRLRSWLLALPAAIPMFFSLCAILAAGRRSEFVLLGVALGSVLYFARNIAPPRALGLALAPLAMAAMFLAPEYRSNTLRGDWGDVRQISASDRMHDVFSGAEQEFWTGAYEMEIADTEHMFQYGIGFYNTFVQYYVPKLIVGEEFKQKLFVPVPAVRYDSNRLAWNYPSGMVPTGPFSVFEQFWYFGAACYYFLAKWLKRCWNRALAGDFISQTIYAVTTTFAVSALTNDFFAIYLPLFMFVLPLMALGRLGGEFHRMARAYSYTPSVGPWPPKPPGRPVREM